MFKGLIAIALFYISIFVFAASTPEVTDLASTEAQTENRIKIAVIDTGLNVDEFSRPYICKHLSKSFVDNRPFSDAISHGTCVTSLIITSLNPKTHCIVMLKFWKPDTEKDVSEDNFIAGIRYAIQIHASFLNVSLGGFQFNPEEYGALKEAVEAKIKISVSSGNNSAHGPERDSLGKIVYKKDANGNKIIKKNIFGIQTCETSDYKNECQYEVEQNDMGQDLDKNCNYFPACYPLPAEYFHVVGSSTGWVNHWGGIHKYGNFGSVVKFYEDGTNRGQPGMTGTSMSTAIHTGKWAAGFIK